METKSSKFNVYKKSAAAQFTYLPPLFNEKGYVKKEGGLLIETALPMGADANGNTTYNWKDKLNFAIGINDICLLLDDVSKRLVHEHEGRIKTLQFTPGQGKYEGTYMLQIGEVNGEEKRSMSIPISAGEFQVVLRLINYIVPKVLGW